LNLGCRLRTSKKAHDGLQTLPKKLATTKAGIVCLTPNNQNAPWLNFEAGALSKTVEKEMVCPYLFQLKSSDVTGALVQFQAAEANKPDTFRLLATLNRAITPKPLSDVMLSETFENWWGKFESRFMMLTSLIMVPSKMTLSHRKKTNESDSETGCWIGDKLWHPGGTHS